MNRIIHFLRDEEGATAIEYALIAGLIAVVLVAALTPVGTQITALFGKITGELTNAAK